MFRLVGRLVSENKTIRLANGRKEPKHISAKFFSKSGATVVMKLGVVRHVKKLST